MTYKGNLTCKTGQLLVSHVNRPGVIGQLPVPEFWPDNLHLWILAVLKIPLLSIHGSNSDLKIRSKPVHSQSKHASKVFLEGLIIYIYIYICYSIVTCK